MSVHMQRQLEHIKQETLQLGTLVEENLRSAVHAVERRDQDMATRVIDKDDPIDKMEVDIEEECLKFLALYQPVAADLRFVVTVLKINNDLERIGDLAVNIAERAAFLATQPPVKVTFDFHRMAGEAQIMLKHSLDALVNRDPLLAWKVCAADDEVDAMNSDMYRQVQRAILQDPTQVQSLLHLLSISRHLERTADLATNIAEEVIYMVEGEIVRHRVEEYHSGQEAPKRGPQGHIHN